MKKVFYFLFATLFTFQFSTKVVATEVKTQVKRINSTYSQTSSGVISSLPWTENFDSYGGVGAAFYPDYWGKKTTISSFPILYSVSNSPPASLYFYATAGNYNIAILPAIDASISINTLNLNLMLRKGDASHHITIGVMSDTSNVNTFDSITNVSPSSVNTWEEFHIKLSSYNGNGKYIAIKVEDPDIANSMYLDDLSIYATTPCTIPFGLTSIESLATPNSITLDWDSNDDKNVKSWIIDYKFIDDDESSWQSVSAQTRPFNLGGLQSSVIYQFRISAICSNNDTTFTSNSIDVGMQCAAITSFPWIEGFEGDWYPASGISNATHPWCWTNIDGGASQSYNWRKTTSASYVRSGSGALQMYAANTGLALSDWIITPTLRLTGNEKLQFWAKGYGTSDDLNIQILNVTSNGVIANTSDTGLFTVIMPNTVIPASNWSEYEISLSQFIGDYQIAFVRNTTGGNYLSIDDISISTIPQCARPTFITFNNILPNSTDISWTLGHSKDLEWLVYYRESGTSTWDSISTTLNPITIHNLTSNTEYEVEIRTNCGSELSLPSILTTFKTPCGKISTFPYIENFDTYGGTGSAYFPDCWDKITTYSTYPYLQTTNHSAPASLYFYTSTNSYNLAILHEIDSSIPIDSLMISFWMRKRNITSTCIIGIMDSLDPASFTPIKSISPSANTTWEKFEVYLNTYKGSGKRIAFKAEYNSATNYFDIDDVVVDYIPTCPKPVKLETYNINPTNAEISWLASNQTYSSWWLFYKETSATALDSVYISNQVNYKFNNLKPNTEYTYYLKTLCSNTYSTSSDVNIFRTPCNPIISLPYSENFDTYGGTGSAYYPDCWTKITTYSTYPYLNSTNYSPPASLYFYATTGNYNLAILNKIDNSISVDSLMISFWIRKSNATSNCIIGIMDSPNNAETFTPIDTVSPSIINIWENFEIYLNSYTGTGKYIAFKSEYNTTTNYFYLDDVVVDNMPKCAKPISLNAYNITPYTADISWLASNKTYSSWWLYYKESSKTEFDSIYVSSQLNYNLSNLNPNTEYTYYLITDCNNKYSSPSFEKTFITPCAPIADLPYTENFDTYGGTGAAYYPDCWSKLTTYSTFPYLHTINHSAPASLYFYATSGNYNLAIINKIDALISMDSLKISFWMMNVFSEDAYCIVGIMDSLDNPETFTPLDTLSPSSPSRWENFELYTNNYTGLGRHIAFKAEGISSSNVFTIDDLTIDYMPTCTKPTHIEFSNITSSKVDVSWRSNVEDISSWWLYWKENSANNYDSINVKNANSYTITNLIHSSEFDFYMISDCNSETSQPTTIKNFFTQCGVVSSFPWKEGFENDWEAGDGISNESATNRCWMNINGGKSTSYKWRKTTNSTIPSYVRTGTGSAQLYGVNQAMGDYLITPIMKLTGNEEMIFWGKGYSTTSMYPENLWIKAYNVSKNGDISSFSDTTLFTDIAFINDTNCYTWNEYEISLNSLQGNYRLVFARDNNVGYNYHIDDLIIDKTPPCPRPSYVSWSHINHNSVKLAWTPGNIDDKSWKIYYKPIDSPNWDSIITTNNPHTLTGLDANTEYEIGVASDCGNGEFSNMKTTSIKTPCSPINSFPWFEGFENTWTSGTGVSNSDVPNECWVNINGAHASYKWRKNTNSSIPAYVRTGSGSAQLYGNGQAMGDYLITPIMELTGNEEMIFWGKGYSTTSMYPENLWIKAYDVTTNGDISSFSDTTLFTDIAFINDTNCYTWNEYEISLNSLQGNYRLVFARDNNVGYNYHIDDLIIDKTPPCPRPSYVSWSHINHNSVKLAWTPGNTDDKSWKIYYKPIDSPNWDSIITTNNPHTLIGLDANTEYGIGVASDCGNGEFSNMKTTSLKTYCNPISSLPWSESFDSYGTTTGSFPECWIRNTSIFNYPYTRSGGFSNACMYFQAKDADGYNIASTPAFDVNINIPSLKATFKYKNANISNALLVGVMTDPSVESSFVIIDTITTPTTGTWYNDTVYFASYTGDGRYLAFRVDYNGTSNYGYLDELEVSYDVCNEPISIAVENITYKSAEITWETGKEETNWEIKINDISKPIILTDNHYELTQLDPNTNYTFYVRSICGKNFYSSWAPISFITKELPIPPVVITSPITEFAHNTAKFKGSYIKGTDTITEVGFRYMLYTLKAKWINEPITTISSPFEFNAIELSPKSIYRVMAYAKTKEGIFYGDTVEFTTKPIHFPIVSTSKVSIFTHNTARFEGSFIQHIDTITEIGIKYKEESSSNWFNATLNTISSPFTYNASGLNPNTSYQVIAYATTHAGIFYGDTMSFITDPLLPPIVITSNISVFTHNTAIFGGDYKLGTDSTIIGVGIKYKEAKSSNWLNATLNTISSPFTFNAFGLNPNTTYKVMAYVTTQDGIFYGDSILFTTNSLPPTITTSNITSYTYNTAVLSGAYTIGSDAITEIGIKYKKETSSNWTETPITPIASPFTYNASGLSPNTSYQVIAYAKTQDGTFYGDTVVFTTDPIISPIVSTFSISVFTYNTAQLTGAYSVGTETITGIGIKYKEATSSTWTDNPITPIASPFTYNASGLSPNTSYQVIAYAKTQDGTFYGDTVEFITKPILSPRVTTYSITTFTHNTATLAGNYIMGTHPITGIGIKYKSQTSSTWTDNSISPISSPFTYNANGLSPNTSYQVIVYAKTQAGTFYGDTVEFITKPILSPRVTTYSITAFTHNTATLAGNYIMGTHPITGIGIKYKSQTSSTWTDNSISPISSPFTHNASGLSPNTSYQVIAYAKTQDGTFYGDTVEFITRPLISPVLTTSVYGITINSAIFTGFYNQGSDPITEIGFKYKDKTSSNWNNESITPITSPFTYNVSGLIPNTSYQVIAYVKTQTSTFYGDTVVFIIPALSPSVNTDNVIVNNIDKSVIFQGTISNGTLDIISRGFEYKASTDDWTETKDIIATGVNNITATATSLHVRKYNVRAYAKTLEGKTYGEVLNFEILSSINGIDGNSLEVNLYPNPASNETTLNIKGISGKAKISISDVQGRIINTFDKEGINGEIKHSLDLNNYAKGVYYIRIQNSNSIKTQKLIVQ